MRILSRSLAALGGSLLSGLVLAQPAGARAEANIGYTREQAFSAALRYLRVDLAYEVTGEGCGCRLFCSLAFRTRSSKKKIGHGSIEVVQRERTVRLLVSLPELLSYREDVLKRGLLEKLHTEYGEPAAPGPCGGAKEVSPKAETIHPGDPPAKP